jgi:hypothetical protein
MMRSSLSTPLHYPRHHHRHHSYSSSTTTPAVPPPRPSRSSSPPSSSSQHPTTTTTHPSSSSYKHHSTTPKLTINPSNNDSQTTTTTKRENQPTNTNNKTNNSSTKRIKTYVEDVERSLKSLSSELSILSSENIRLQQRIQSLESTQVQLRQQYDEQKNLAQEYLEKMEKQSFELTKRFAILRFSSLSNNNISECWQTLLTCARNLNMDEFKRCVRQLGNHSISKEAPLFTSCMSECLYAACLSQANQLDAQSNNTTLNEFVRWCLSLGAQPSFIPKTDTNTSPITALQLACGKLPGDDVTVLESMFAYCSSECVDFPLFTTTTNTTTTDITTANTTTTTTTSSTARQHTQKQQLGPNERTLLMEAAIHGKTNRVQFLLQHHADFTQRDSNNRTAADLCMEQYPETHLILTKGKDIYNAATHHWSKLFQQENFLEAFQIQTLCSNILIDAMENDDTGDQFENPKTLLYHLFATMAQTMMKFAYPQYLTAEQLISNALELALEEHHHHLNNNNGDDENSSCDDSDTMAEEFLPILLALRVRARLGVYNFQGALLDLESICKMNFNAKIATANVAIMELVKMMKSNPFFVFYGNYGPVNPNQIRWPPSTLKQTISLKDVKHTFYDEARRTHPDKQIIVKSTMLPLGMKDDGSRNAKSKIEFVMFSEAYSHFQGMVLGEDSSSRQPHHVITFPETPLSSVLTALMENPDFNPNQVQLNSIEDFLVMVDVKLKQFVEESMR